MERSGQREQARVWGSLRTPVSMPDIRPTIPGHWGAGNGVCGGRMKMGEEMGATHNGAGIDVIAPRRAALHLQLDASMVICTDPTPHPRNPSSHWGPGTSATQPEPGAQPLPQALQTPSRRKAGPAGLTHRVGSQGGGSF